jgi:hypothetical protein
MRFIATLLILSLACLTGCETTPNELKPLSEVSPSVSREGTLANDVLVNDTTRAIKNILNIGSEETVEIEKFVIQSPVGEIGNKAWREMWVTSPGGKNSKWFIITFREDGKRSANFEISEM